MRISDLISMTVKNLLRRKMRTILTVMGVVVGTCSIVVMVSLGIGQTQALEQNIAQMGDLTLISIYNYNENSETPLNDETMQQILAMDGVKAATPYMNSSQEMKLYSGKKDRYQMYLWGVNGVYADQLDDMGVNVIEGELLPETTQSGKNKKYKILMGRSMVYDFTDTKASGQAAYRWEGMLDANGVQLEPFVDVMEDELTLVIPNMEFDEQGKPLHDDIRLEAEVVGIVGSSDPNNYSEDNYSVYMDINDIRELRKLYLDTFDIKPSREEQERFNKYNNAKVKAENVEDVEMVDTAIKELGFETYSLNSVREPMMEQMQQQQLFLGGIGGISLIVAAIGISNTMVMSIYERTREIGIMKVLGCKLGNIRSIFLFEAGLIGFFGGLCGLGISYGLSFVLNYLSNGGMMGEGIGSLLGGMAGMGGGSSLSVIPPWLAVAAVVFATFIGLISGFSPANRAVKISALEAIKHE